VRFDKKKDAVFMAEGSKPGMKRIKAMLQLELYLNRDEAYVPAALVKKVRGLEEYTSLAPSSCAATSAMPSARRSWPSTPSLRREPSCVTRLIMPLKLQLPSGEVISNHTSSSSPLPQSRGLQQFTLDCPIIAFERLAALVEKLLVTKFAKEVLYGINFDHWVLSYPLPYDVVEYLVNK
jgi:hypothetical protein